MTLSSPVRFASRARSIAPRIAWHVSGAAIRPSVFAKIPPAWNVLTCSTARGSTIPWSRRTLRLGAIPWYRSPPAWIRGGTKAWPGGCILKRGARGRRAGDEARVPLPLEPLADHRVREAGEVRASADGPDHHVGHNVEVLELLDHLKADHALVQEDMVRDAPDRVLRVRGGDGSLDRLGDRDPEGPGVVPVVLQERAAVVRLVARARVHLRAVHAHDELPVRLLVVRHADHEHLRAEVEHARRKRDGGTPLSGPRLRREGLPALLLRVVRLGDGRVRLVRPDRAQVLALVVDLRGGLQVRLEPHFAVHRGRAAEPGVG